MSDLSRREFLGQAAGTVAAAAVTSGIASGASSDDKLTVALIGCGGMGGNHLKLLAERKDAHIAYLCDADTDRLAAAVKTVEAAGKPAPKPVKDMRTIFDDKSVDAVWLPMPDHWHAPATILACAAGKHVYNGNAFYGTKGMLILGKGSGFHLYAARNKLVEKMDGSANLPAHHQNFIDCIRSGKRPNADIAEGHLSASLAHLGNIACRVGRTLRLDPTTERIIDDPQADVLLKRSYRADHWAVPAGV